jgi:hypothetical protein
MTLRRSSAVVILVGIPTALLLVALSLRAFTSSGTEGTDTEGLIRWGNVVVRQPADSTVSVTRTSLPKEENPPDGGLVLYLEKPPSRLVISAENGSVLYDSVMDKDMAAFEEITATIVVGAATQGSLGWPYTPDAPPGPRDTYGSLKYHEPDPSSGIEVYAM